MIRRLVRVLISPAVAAGVLVVALIVGASWLVDHLGQGRLHPDRASRPKNETALVLGTLPRLGARANPHLDNRIAAAADLLRRGLDVSVRPARPHSPGPKEPIAVKPAPDA